MAKLQITPHLTLSNASAAIDFYKKGLGAKEVMRMKNEDGSKLMHANIVVNGTSVYLADDFPEYPGSHTPERLGGTPVTMHVTLEKPAEVDKWIARAEKAGAKVTMPAADMFWGDRYGVIIDPFGHSWAFGAALPKPKKARKKPAKKAKAKPAKKAKRK